MPVHPFYLREVVLAVTYLSDGGAAFQWVQPGLLGQTWSLACEEQFYLLWPPILLLTLRYRPALSPWIELGLAIVSTAWCAFLCLNGSDFHRTTVLSILARWNFWSDAPPHSCPWKAPSPEPSPIGGPRRLLRERRSWLLTPQVAPTPLEDFSA
jgi:peptidoglycan/LPS O-acetylase OafA/YrhL